MAIREHIHSGQMSMQGKCNRCFQHKSTKLCRIPGSDMFQPLCDECKAAVNKTEKEYQKFANWIMSGEMTAQLEHYRKVDRTQKMLAKLAWA
jgi:hypothetical protein